MKSITEQKTFGTVHLRLKEYMDTRGIKRGTLARHIGTRFEVIDKWYNGDMKEIDLDILARICFVLECNISDLLVYEAVEA